MSCPLNTTWELFSSKRLSNSQALKKNLFQFPTLWLNFFGWGGIKTHMVIFYHSSVVRSNTASFVQHCPRCKGGKRKSVCVFLFEMTKPSLDLPYKIIKTIGSRERGERKAALREINFPCTTVFAGLYGQTAELWGWGRDSAQSPGHPLLDSLRKVTRKFDLQHLFQQGESCREPGAGAGVWPCVTTWQQPELSIGMASGSCLANIWSQFSKKKKNYKSVCVGVFITEGVCLNLTPFSRILWKSSRISTCSLAARAASQQAGKSPEPQSSSPCPTVWG